MVLSFIDDYALLLKFLSRAGKVSYRCSSGKMCTLYMNENMQFFVDGTTGKILVHINKKFIEFFLTRLKYTQAVCSDVYENRWSEIKDIVNSLDRKVVCLNGSLS